METKHIGVTFRLVDVLNPGCGYQIEITDEDSGLQLLFTGNHPVTRKPLLTASECLEVASMYTTAARVSSSA